MFTQNLRSLLRRIARSKKLRCFVGLLYRVWVTVKINWQHKLAQQYKLYRRIETIKILMVVLISMVGIFLAVYQYASGIIEWSETFFYWMDTIISYWWLVLLVVIILVFLIAIFIFIH